MHQKKKMITRFFRPTSLIFLGLLCFQMYPAEKAASLEIERVGVISSGMKAPQIKLDNPRSEQDSKYLSLKDPGSFSLSQLPAKLIVLEVFSVVCPHCQAQASKLNEIYNLIQQDLQLSRDIKIIGISMASNQEKTDKWKAALHVPFPLFADFEGEIWKKLGKPSVPFILLIDKDGKVLHTHSGVIENADEFFSTIKNVYKKL